MARKPTGMSPQVEARLRRIARVGARNAGKQTKVYFEATGMALKFQSQPVEQGRNGVLIEEVYDALIERLRSCQAAVPCEHNLRQIELLELAKQAQLARVADRQARGVTGTTAA